jgi:hypothetical protein
MELANYRFEHDVVLNAHEQVMHANGHGGGGCQGRREAARGMTFALVCCYRI